MIVTVLEHAGTSARCSAQATDCSIPIPANQPKHTTLKDRNQPANMERERMSNTNIILRGHTSELKCCTWKSRVILRCLVVACTRPDCCRLPAQHPRHMPPPTTNRCQNHLIDAIRFKQQTPTKTAHTRHAHGAAAPYSIRNFSEQSRPPSQQKRGVKQSAVEEQCKEDRQTDQPKEVPGCGHPSFIVTCTAPA